MTIKTDIIIVGGGMVGCALACALREQHIHVTLVEQAEHAPRLSLGRDCRVSAIVSGTVEILRGLGVWSHIHDQAGAIETMRVWDNQATGGIRFEAAEIGQDALGYIVENSVLQDAMLDLLADSNVNVECPARITSVRWAVDAVHVQLDDGRKLTTALIVAADGGHSWLRQQAGIRVLKHPFGQQAIVANVRPQMPARHTAFQRFLPTGPLALLPLADDLYSMVWSAHEQEVSRLMALDDAGFSEALYLAFGPILGKLEAVGDRAAFPLRSQIAPQMVQSRLALIGDAAHVVHPLAGLGVNLGIRDAMVLAQEIADARRFDEDWGSLEVLHRVAHNRMPDNLSIIAGMEAFHHLFANHLPGLSRIRGMGMAMVGNSGLFKRMLMRAGTGLSLPVPRQIDY